LKSILALGVTFVAAAWLHLSSTAVLVSAGPVTERGEGGPAFDCTYLGTGGFFYVSRFYEAERAEGVTVPRGQSQCSWFCAAALGPRDRGRQLARCD
jgi:hypothetical protein